MVNRFARRLRSPLVVAALGVAAVAAAQRFALTAPGETPATDARQASGWLDEAQPAPVRPAAAAVGQAGPAAPLDWRILENPNGQHTALIFDPVRRVFAVYHVDSASGQIMLRSVRSVSADLRLEQFNSSNPAPKDIRGMLDEAR